MVDLGVRHFDCDCGASLVPPSDISSGGVKKDTVVETLDISEVEEHRGSSTDSALKNEAERRMPLNSDKVNRKIKTKRKDQKIRKVQKRGDEAHVTIGVRRDVCNVEGSESEGRIVLRCPFCDRVVFKWEKPSL